MSWDVSGSGLGTFSDGFGMVWEKMSDGVEKLKFSKMTGSIFPGSGHSKYTFLDYPGRNVGKLFFAVFLYINSRSTALSGLYVNRFQKTETGGCC